MSKVQISSKNFDASMFEIDAAKGMVNLTKIAQHFGKEVHDWKRLPNTISFLHAFEEKYSDTGKSRNTKQSDFIYSYNGNSGIEQGTWAHRKIAIKFSQWISPQFEVFCIDMLDELFQKGHVVLNTAESLESVVYRLKSEFEEFKRQTGYSKPSETLFKIESPVSQHVGRPKVHFGDDERRNFNTMLQLSLIEKIKKLAFKKGVTNADVINAALTKYFEG